MSLKMDREKIEKIIEDAWKFVEEKLKTLSHDLEHVKRVYKLSLQIASHYPEVDLDVLRLAVILHDIAREEEDRDYTGKIDHAILGAEIAREFLKKYDLPEEFIEKVVHCIRTHRFRSFEKPQTLEAKILFDADKIDALGAIGLVRSILAAGEHNQNIWLINVDLEKYKKENLTEEGRIKDLRKHSPWLEYELKFRKLPERLYTEYGKKIAKKKIRIYGIIL